MSDCDWECASNTSATSARGEEAFARKKAGLQKGELNSQLMEYIKEWRKTREKDEEELRKLKEKQARRKEIRAEQERILNQQKKEDEDRLRREEAERRAEVDNSKIKRLREAEAKRQQMMEAQKSQIKDKGSKSSGGAARPDVRRELSKTREQLEEEQKLALAMRIKPLDLGVMDTYELKEKAMELYNIVVQLETDKYDFEQRKISQDYELKELKGRQKTQLRQKAIKKGLDPDALFGAHPPKVHMYSKYERRLDTRTYDDRKKLYEGGWDVIRLEAMENMLVERYEEWASRPAKRLPRWFGERPGRKVGEPETPVCDALEAEDEEEDVEEYNEDEEYSEEEYSEEEEE